jgi:hypothetical protein
MFGGVQSLLGSCKEDFGHQERRCVLSLTRTQSGGRGFVRGLADFSMAGCAVSRTCHLLKVRESLCETSVTRRSLDESTTPSSSLLPNQQDSRGEASRYKKCRRDDFGQDVFLVLVEHK